MAKENYTKEEVQEMIEALKFYADYENWFHYEMCKSEDLEQIITQVDEYEDGEPVFGLEDEVGGLKARTVLRKIGAL